MPGSQLRLVDPLTSIPPWEQDEEPPPIPRPGRHVDTRSSAFTEALLPQRWRGRIAVEPWHVVAVAVLVCAALAVATWLTLRHQPHVITAAGLPSAAAGPTGSAAAAPSTTTVTVDVEGTVARPGIVVLPLGSRVVDAVKAAGGPFHRSQLSGLNLATVLSDGQQVVVGATGAAAGGATAADGRVNLNTATAEDLDAVPGVGPVTAASIVTWREHNGAFHNVDELLEVDGIGPGKLARIKPHVTV